MDATDDTRQAVAWEIVARTEDRRHTLRAAQGRKLEGDLPTKVGLAVIADSTSTEECWYFNLEHLNLSKPHKIGQTSYSIEGPRGKALSDNITVIDNDSSGHERRRYINLPRGVVATTQEDFTISELRQLFESLRGEKPPLLVVAPC